MSGADVLIESRRHTRRDLDRWEIHEETDRVEAERTNWAREEGRALDAILAFAAAGPCYAGVSWGKDSVVVAHLIAAAGLGIPLVWVRVEPIENPDCLLVRDAFLARYPAVRYLETEAWCEPHHSPKVEKGIAHEWGWTARGTLEAGFAEAHAKLGTERHISGVRAAESSTRKLRMLRWGENTPHTCAPIGWWPTSRVFAYLHLYELPVHPAYACSQGGLWDRERIRVSALGRTRGQGVGRWEWEHTYYRAEMRALERLAQERLS